MDPSDKTDPGLAPPVYVPPPPIPQAKPKPKAKMGLGLKVVVGCGVVWAALVAFGLLLAVISPGTPKATTAPSISRPPTPQQAPKDPFTEMTTKQHLDRISNLVMQVDIRDADVYEAQKHLTAIPDGTPERAKAKSLMVKMDQRKTAQKREREIEARKAYASAYETTMLDRGINMTVTAVGKDATTLRMEYALTTKVSAHALGKNDGFWMEVRTFGFKKVVMTNGFQSSLGETWTWKLD